MSIEGCPNLGLSRVKNKEKYVITTLVYFLYTLQKWVKTN